MLEVSLIDGAGDEPGRIAARASGIGIVLAHPPRNDQLLFFGAKQLVRQSMQIVFDNRQRKASSNP